MKTKLAAMLAVAALLTGSRATSAQTYSFTLNQAQVNVIGDALKRRPYEDVVSVINEISGQMSAQQLAAVDKAKADAEAKNKADAEAKANADLVAKMKADEKPLVNCSGKGPCSDKVDPLPPE